MSDEYIKPTYDELVTSCQQLWYCIKEGYTDTEAEIHMRAHKMGRTTIKKYIIEEVEVDDV